MKTWDVFISHASDDNTSVVLPLADALRRAGLGVWLDRTELTVGDSLREKIDDGLARSRFGVVVLSNSFLAKGWTRKELNGLMALEEDGHKVILPVWHHIDRSVLMEYSPILADRLAVNTADGIPTVAAAIVRVVLQPGSGSPSELTPTVAIRLSRLLEGVPDTQTIRWFLAAHRGIFEMAGVSDAGSLLTWCDNVTVPESAEGLIPDLCVGKLWPTRGRRLWEVFLFEPPAQPLFGPYDDPAAFLLEAVDRIAAFRQWVSGNLAAARQLLPDVAPNFFATIVAGRRSGEAQSADRLGRFNDSLVGVRLRTYDWLIEASSRMSGTARERQ